MSAIYRQLSSLSFVGAISGATSDIGERPQLLWVPLRDMVIDARYQREIGTRGRANVIRIAREFDWRKFTPAFITMIPDGRNAIVDGQHRCTAALLRGIDEVPCCRLVMTPEQQAEAFAAINANVTAVTPLQLYASRLLAGDRQAKALQEVCQRAGVSICRYPVASRVMKPGETLAVGCLTRLLDQHGARLLEQALLCITATQENAAGLVNPQIVGALCSVLTDNPGWRGPRLLAAMRGFDLRKAFRNAKATHAYRDESMREILADVIAGHLDFALGRKAG